MSAYQKPISRLASFIFISLPLAGSTFVTANDKVHVSRFWHNHQPTYWPEWNNNGPQTSRVQYAWDSIVLKSGQNYGGLSPKQHPENNLTEIFGLDDRRNSYQSGPRNSLSSFNNAGGFAISYSGSLIDNIRQLGSLSQLGYSSGWNNGYREARGWLTPAGSTRMDLVGFTYHHSLAPLLPKSVFRKELQIFKQAWWKAWGGNANLSDHSKGFFPTEMAYSRHMIDVLADEGYQWLIVPSHHISRTCPTYNTKANPTGSYNIYSSPPNRADQLGPSPTDGWWFGEPDPGKAAWNVSPYAYQLHKVKHVNPETGAEKTMIAVPSDDVLSYRYGYANEGIGKIGQFISPFATDSTRPVIVMPSTDGDNAWGGGSSSWFEATPQLFNESVSAGYRASTPQDFVNAHGAAAPVAHIEDGAWIFPDMCYGSPNFLKWIEPPVSTVANRGITTVPGTQIDMETPGFALKFYSYAPLMAGANWCETAEQILRDEGGSVQPWKIQVPYDWEGTWTNPNEVELAWHIYLAGLDSGFNYYGGLGNDDEMKPGLATRRAVEKLTPWIDANNRRSQDRTAPTVLKPQRFPYNPGGYTFGWFNNVPGVDTRFLKRMNSEFYIWTHAYDVSGIPDGNLKVKIRIDNDGNNPLASNQNETYAGGNEVGSWVTITMNKRELPKTRAALNAAAANIQIDYFLPTNEVADYYFANITDTNLPGFRDKLLDYYVEATDSKGNVHKSDIQQVYVENFSGAGGGGGSTPSPIVTTSPTTPVVGSPVTITYDPAGRNLASTNPVYIHIAPNEWVNRVIPRPQMTLNEGKWQYTYTPPAGTTNLRVVFTANPESSNNLAWDNNGGADWNLSVNSAAISQAPAAPTGLSATVTSSTAISLSWNNTATASSYIVYRNGISIATPQDPNHADTNLNPETTYNYTVVAVNSVGNSPPSTQVPATTPFAPVGNTTILILDPVSNPETTSANYNFSGRAGALFTTGLRWSNAANNERGSITTSDGNITNGWEWNTSIPLATGSNTVTFSGDYPTTRSDAFSDAAANYSSWSTGSTGGTGFGSWYLTPSGAGGFFLAGNSTHSNMNVGAANGFGLWANNGGSTKATRNFLQPMQSGDTYSIRIDNNNIQSGGNTGFELRDANGNKRFAFYFVGGQANYRIDDATTARDTNLGWTGNGLTLTLTLGSNNSYSLNTGSSAITGTLASGNDIAWIEFYNNNAGSGDASNFYFGEMSHTRLTAESATINQSATITRSVLNENTDGLPNLWWDQYFGTTSGMSASADPDSDGFTNAQEYALGTNPANANSAFRITNLTRTTNSVTITWSSVSGKSYKIQNSNSLNDNSWQDIANSQITATSSSSNQTVTTNSFATRNFYRVMLVE
jgi:hypothetical protein